MRALSLLKTLRRLSPFALGAAVATALFVDFPDLGPGLKDSRITRDPSASIFETLAVSAPLRQVLRARAERADALDASADPGAAAADPYPHGAASRRAFARLAKERARRGSNAPAKLDLGPNASFEAAVAEASTRSGLSAEAIAALIDAEARKTRSGRWDPKSKNPASSARGLAQFLARTWLEEASKPGRFLRREAEARGYVTARGAPANRQALLAMRLEPRVAIIAAAEMAAANLLRLARYGYAPLDDEAAAHLAYLAHHEGVAGARAHLAGRTTRERAARRLAVNISVERANQLLADHDQAPHRAYAAWLEQYIKTRIRPARFLRLAAPEADPQTTIEQGGLPS